MEDTTFHFKRSHSLHQELNTQFQPNSRNKNKSCSNFLVKFVLIALFLSVLPLFPSEPPESISHTVFASTWELFRLLVIGIALSYGLFCCRKIPQFSPKPQISSPYVANVLQHSSIFDYENENQSGILQKNAIPTQSYNLSDYRSENYVVVGRNSSKNFDERPLGLPIRSLRSRVLDSDSNNDGDEECASECESDSSDNLEENVTNSSPLSWRSRSMRGDFVDENGSNFVQKCEPKQSMSQSFRLPTQHHPMWVHPHGGSLNIQQQQQPPQYSMESRYPGIWEGQDVRNLIPDNKCMSSCFLGGFIPPIERENIWKGDGFGFGMPFSEMPTQWNDPTNVVGEMPNLDKGNLSWGNPKFNAPLAVVPPSMPDPSNEFGLRFRKYSHENMNFGCDKTPFFMPSAPTPHPMPDPSGDFGLRSRKYSHENVSLGQSSSMENMNIGCDKTEFFMPSSATPPSTLSPSMNDFASLTQKHIHESVSLGQSPNSEDGNLGREKTELFKPSSAASPSVSVPDKDLASPVKRMRSRKLGPENINSGKSPNLENGTLVVEKTNSSIPSSVNSPFMSTPEKGFASSVKRSRSRRISPVTSLKKDEHGSEKDNVGNFVEEKDSQAPHFVDPLKLQTRRDDFGSVINDSSLKKDEQRSIPAKWDEDCFVIPSSENNDIGSLDQEDQSHGLTDCSESALSTSSSSRGSSEELGSQQVEVEENVTHSASANSSEIEDLGTEIDSYKPSTPSPPPQKDFGKEISYKPSTPSPPPQLQARRNNIASLIESSSNTLGKGSLLSEDDDMGPSPKHERGKALSKASHSRRFSCGSFFDRDPRKSFKDEAKEANKKNKGDQPARGGKCGWDCFNLDVRPTLTKAALKGKSVRTIKPREIPLETNDNKGSLLEPKSDQVEHKHEENGASLMGRSGERKGEKQEMVVIQIGISEKRSNSSTQKGDKQGNAGTSIIVGLNSKQNSKGTSVAAVSEVKEEETDNDEIDRKAGEFIAKFKEQIRLQKVASKAESGRHQHARQSSLLYS